MLSTNISQLKNVLSYTWILKTNSIHITSDNENLIPQKPETMDEFIGQIHPDDQVRFKNNLNRYLSEKEEMFETFYRRLKGEKWVWYRDLGKTTERDSSGNPLKMIMCGKELTTQPEKNDFEESDRKYKELFEKSMDAILVLQKSKITDCNQATLNLFGYGEKSELLNKNPYELSPEMQPDGRVSSEKAERMISIALSEGKNRFEWDHKRKDGEVFAAEVVLTSINLSDGNKIIHAVVRDITARKKAEERFKIIFEDAPDAYFLCDLSGQIIDGNRAAVKLMGYDKGELVGGNFLQLNLIESDQIPKVVEILEKLSEGNDIKSIELDIIRKNGSKVKVEISTHIVKIEGNTQVLGIARDITYRKETEAELKKLHTAIEQSPVSVIITDKTGSIEYVNKTFYKLTGYGPQDVPYYSIKDLVVGKSANLNFEKIWESISAGKTWQGQLQNQRANGEQYWEYSIISAIKNNNEITNFIIVKEDITESKRTQKALIESKRLGAIAEMSAAVAHDFNNSLQSIFGNLELALLNIDENHPVEEYLKTIKTVTSDAANRVKILQRFAGNTKYKKEYELIDVNELVNDVLIQSRPIWKDETRKVGLSISVDKNLKSRGIICGNPGELRSVLYNIIKNSIEAMPKGGSISVDTSDSQKGIIISIRDTGVGMNEETRSRIFQPFFTTKGFETGRGLGMSGVYSIIQEHNGKIEVVKSVPGEGTEIAITLPRAELSNRVENKKEGSSSQSKRSAKVLWVDDEKMIREVAAEMLKSLGHIGEVVANGNEAVQLLRNKKFDLVITDIGMPGMTGWELADKINEIGTPAPILAVLTGWGDQISEEKKKQHGVKYVIGKPFSINNLKTLIESAIQ